MQWSGSKSFSLNRLASRGKKKLASRGKKKLASRGKKRLASRGKIIKSTSKSYSLKYAVVG